MTFMGDPGADTTAGADTEQVTCKFPGCGEPPEPKDPAKPGPAPEYCAREDHNPGTKWRHDQAAKRAAKKAAGMGGAAEPDTDKPVTDSAAEAVNVREQVVRYVVGLQDSLERYVTLLETVSDPEAAEVQVLAVESEANTRIALADARADQERARRVTAEQFKDAAEADRRAADQAAGQMVEELEAARTQFAADVERITAEADARVEAAQTAVEDAREEAGRQVAEARALAETHVNAARQGAADEIAAIRRACAEEVQTAQNTAGQARAKAERDIAEMTRVLEEAQAAAAAQVEDANGKTAAAQARTAEAEETARQARRDAEAMVQAVKDAAETVRAGLQAELERTNARLESREVRVDELRNELDGGVKDKLRAAQERARTAEQELRAREEHQGDTE